LFRVLVTDAYQKRCAITGERTLPVLDAAHIKPYVPISHVYAAMFEASERALPKTAKLARLGVFRCVTRIADWLLFRPVSTMRPA
jgi:hypothetical protein